MSLDLLFIERIVSGLKRQSITTCAKWAENYRVMDQPFPGKWSFRHHPWLKEMHDSVAEFNVGQKSAQMGYTETVLNVVFYNIDVMRRDCLYVLPSKTPDASDFSAARFDPALELSEHLAKIFSDVKNIGHKRAGTTNLYIRGSKSRAGLKSVPTGLVILDEVEEMDQDNIPLAMERMSGQIHKQCWAISTPRIHEEGINKLYNTTTQEHYFFKCPSCNKMTELIFPECLIIAGDDPNDIKIKESQLICKECKNELHHETKHDWLSNGQWVPSCPEGKNPSGRGFYINQLYSSASAGRPHEIAAKYLRSLTNEADEQELYNSTLGLPHTVAGARITDEDIEKVRKEYRNGQTRPKSIVTIGIDVGKFLHYEIDEWYLPNTNTSVDLNVNAKSKVIDIGKVTDFDDIDRLLIDYRIHSGVIDANPERRKAYELACRFPGLIFLCFYGWQAKGRQITLGLDDKKTGVNEPFVTVDRTSWLDLSLGRFRRGDSAITLPMDTPYEYKSHLKALVRLPKKDKTGNLTATYENGSREDHYAHARNYSEIAFVLALRTQVSENIGNVL